MAAEVFPWDGRERSSAGVWRYRRRVLRVLFSGGRVEPSLLYFLAAAVWADDRTFLIFCRSQGLRERPGAGVAEKPLTLLHRGILAPPKNVHNERILRTGLLACQAIVFEWRKHGPSPKRSRFRAGVEARAGFHSRISRAVVQAWQRWTTMATLEPAPGSGVR